MADLIAQGDIPQHRWRRTLPDGELLTLGRAAGVWDVPWDQHISRRHATLRWTGQRLEVTKLPDAQNAVFHSGRETARCDLAPGEHFVIGRTTFTLSDQRAHVAADAPQPAQQQSFSSQYLKEIRFRNPDHRIEVLSRVPEVISQAADDGELCVSLVSMLLAGIQRCDTAAVVAGEDDPAVERTGGKQGREGCHGRLVRPCRSEQQGRTSRPWHPSSQPDNGDLTRYEDDPAQEERPPVGVLHWDRRLVTEREFQPSQRLILEALKQRQSVLHVWQQTEPTESQPFTARGNVDWAFCTPVPGEASRGWGLYVAGRFAVEPANMSGSTDPSDLREDVKFAELVALVLSSLLQLRQLERRQASLSQFFSPVVLNTISVADPDVVLAPRETEVSVLFCDLRGFSRRAEREGDDLMELLNRVSKALGVMTHQILDQGGVVGDFQGDAAMGFWGWPLASEDNVVKTCRAALGIRAEFEAAARQTEGTLAGFHAGVGIATGRAVAGKIGTVDQVKVSVFGPVVNLASRLEGMTKILRAPILLDDRTASAVREQVPRDVARVRRLAVVRPYGLDTPLEVSELLPPESAYPLLTDEHLDHCEAALDAFLGGDWSAAFELLHRTPTEDRVTDFLTVYIAQHNRTPPADWDGVIGLSSK